MKNVLVIAPFSLKQNILNDYRKDNPFIDVKCVSKEELLNDKFGHYIKDSIAYVMLKFNCSYEKARTLLKYARLINKDSKDNKVHELYELKNDLIDNGFLVLNPYYSELLKNKEIIVQGYSKLDRELTLLLEGNDATYIVNPLRNCGGAIEKFPNLDEEILYMLNNIADLISQGIEPKDIYILCNDELANYYIEKYARTFGFDVNFEKGISFYSTTLVNDFIAKYKELDNLGDTLEWLFNVDSSFVGETIDLIKENIIPSLNKDQQLDYLIGEFKKHELSPIRYKNAVSQITSMVNKKNAHVFVPCFVQGSYPVVYKDNEYLSDKQLQEQGLNTSFIKGSMIDDIMLSMFSSDCSFYFSYSNHSYSSNYYASPWIKKLNLVEIKPVLPKVFYSANFSFYLYGKSKDELEVYSKTTPEYLSLKGIFDTALFRYKDYKNQYNGADVYDATTYLTHSYSSMKMYYECPFKYYLTYGLGLDKFIGNFNSNKGNVAHEVFSKMFDQDFDFEDAFGLAMYKYEWSAKEKVFLEGFKEQIKLAVEASLNHYNNHMNKLAVLTEEDLSFQMTHFTKIRGIADKIIVLKNDELVVVDYKTGSEGFDFSYLEKGYSMQLPTYSYLIHNNERLKEFDVVGLYINHVCSSNSSETKVKKDEIIPNYLKLDGVTINEMSSINNIDDTLVNGSSSAFLGGIYMQSSGLKSNRHVVTREELARYESIVSSLYGVGDFNIRQNKFEINPMYLDKQTNACERCPFKDICFNHKRIINKLKDSEEEEVE